MFKTYLRNIYLHNQSEEQPSEIVIFGNVDLCTDGLNWGLIFSHLKLGNIVDCICYEQPPKHVMQMIQGQNCETLRLHKLYIDPCGWLSSQQLAKNSWSNMINLKKDNGGKKNVIFINKIENALLFKSESEILKSIQDLRQDEQVFQVIIGCAADVVGDAFIKALRYMCSCSIDLYVSTALTADIIFKKRSGKVIKTSEEFHLNSDLSIIQTKLVNQKKITDMQESNTQFHTSFNLSTTVEQEEARRGVVLPYTRIQNTSGAAIHYVPDDGDDWDDEDPDEDLEI